jgi:hypothetical protein
VRKLRVVCRMAGMIAAAGLVSAAVAGPGTGSTPTRAGKPFEGAAGEAGKGERTAPSNDTCAGAILVSSNSTTLADQREGTQTGDPGYSCHNGGAGTQGFANIWYKFVATSTTARVQTCDTTAVGDSLIGAYDVDESDPCNTLTEIGCNDDTCGFTGFLSRVDLLSLVVGQTYYVQVGAWTATDVGVYTMQIQSPIPAVTVTCPPGATLENESDCVSVNPGCAGQGGGPNPAFNSPITLPATVCGTSRLDSLSPLTRDNDYYKFHLNTESQVTVGCTAEFSAQCAIVNAGGVLSCPNPFAFWEQINPVAGQTLTMTVCLAAGDWLILVRPNAGQATFGCTDNRKYILTAVNNGPCQSCPITPPPGAMFENEIASSGDCGGWISTIDFYNGGCNSVPPVFSPVACGDVIFGSTASTGARRDTDWYELTISNQTDVTWEGTSEYYELVIGIIDLAGVDTCPATALFRTAGLLPACSTGSVSATLPPGSYAFFAAADFTPAINCPGTETNPNYKVRLICGGEMTDCNKNGIDDAVDIKSGSSSDCFDYGAAAIDGVFVAGGANGIPDECECIADWDRNGVSNSTDVSELINTYFYDQVHGTIYADVDCNGVSNSTDVSNFINVWFSAQAGQLPFAGCSL